MDPRARTPEQLAELDADEAARIARHGRLLWACVALLLFLALVVYLKHARDVVDEASVIVAYLAMVALGVLIPVLRGQVDGRDRVLFGASVAFAFGALTGIAGCVAMSFELFGFQDGSYSGQWHFSGPGDLPMLAIYCAIMGLMIGVPTAFVGMLAALVGGVVRRGLVGSEDELEDELELF